MTEAEVVKSVQSKLNDYTDPMKQRIQDAVSIGIAMFCAEYPWEFLSAYTTTSEALDATSSKYYVTKPSAMFKPIYLWTDNIQEIGYIPNSRWADLQRSTSGSADGRAYTVIGTTMFLDDGGNGDTIYIIYTQDSAGITLDEVPGQYHAMIVAAIVLWLTPEVLELPNDQKVRNAAYDAAESRYVRMINKATRFEMTNKGRPKSWGPNQTMKDRAQWPR